MALSAARNLPHFPDQEIREFPVVANAVIYRGALLSIRSSGYVDLLAAGEQFAGVAYENKTGTGTSGAVKVRAYVRGTFEHPLSSAAVTDLGDAIYATADDAISKTATNNTYIGRCVGFVDSATILVDIDAAFGQIAAP